MKIALAQINTTLGDFSQNMKNALAHIKNAKDNGADLVIFPELSLFGYHPMDLLERSDSVKEQAKFFSSLTKKLPVGVGVLVGLIEVNTKKGKPYYNSAALVQKNKKPKFFRKELHPTYDVFDDLRHFEAGDVAKNKFKFKGKKIQLLLCEDMWGWDERKYTSSPLKKLKGEKFDLVINMSASPFHPNKEALRHDVARKTVKLLKAPLAYVNMVGAQDELIFDGSSFVMNQKGQVCHQLGSFQEELFIYDSNADLKTCETFKFSKAEKHRSAIVSGISDFVKKIGFKKVHLGLSGGVDSAVVFCLAAEALGRENVVPIAMPSRFSTQESTALAEELVSNFDCKLESIEIQSSYESILASFSESFSEFPFGLVNENLQARIRGLLLMTYSNRYGSILLTTGNKSEYATGYTTLYGDMCGGLAPIGDLLKGEVFDLAKLYLDEGFMPEGIITRPPSAELRPNQKDSDSLPPYDKLDKAVNNIVTLRKPARTKIEKWVLQQLLKTEFKRWQAPPILKVSEHSFGRGRRVPIAHRSRS